MKKTFLFVCAALLTLSLSAQDLGKAVESYNTAAGLFSVNKAQAIAGLQDALKQAEACEEDAEGQRNTLIENCKSSIANFTLSIAKDYLKADEFDKACEQLKAAVDVAGQYGIEDVANEASDLIPTAYLAKGNQALKNKDFLGAADAYQKVLELNPGNGKAALNLGMAQSQAGNIDAAEEAFKKAMEAGEDKAAAKQLGKLYLKKANGAYKAGNFKAAYDAAMTSIEYDPSANAYKIAGNACVKSENKAKAVECFEKYLQLSPNAKDAEQIKATIAILKK